MRARALPSAQAPPLWAQAPLWVLEWAQALVLAQAPGQESVKRLRLLLRLRLDMTSR